MPMDHLASPNLPASGKSYRYPGATPFSTDQQHIFFGRRKDTENLARLLHQESIAVLYGKSGLGKSSLLNAGLIPKLKEEGSYHPIVIRLYAFSEGSKSPLDTVSSSLAVENPKESEKSILYKLLPNENSLWFHAKNRQLLRGEQPLLIFDQFEELFSYPEEKITEFLQALSELRYTRLPLRLRLRLQSEAGKQLLKEEDEDALEEALELRLLFAIRSDRFHLLSRLTAYLPFGMSQTYELKALLPEDAREAIINPAAVDNPGAFETPPFKYSEKGLTALLEFLSEASDKRVEGILLQMLCEHYEQKLVKEQGVTLLDMEHIGNPNNVVANYYHNKIAGLDESNRAAASRLIEEGLISENQGIRLSLHEANILSDYEIGRDVLDALVNSRLLRAEPFLRGGYTYELSHDRLVPAVLDAREKSRKLKAAEKARQKENELKTARKRTRLVAVIAVLSMVLAGVAFWQYGVAKQAKATAEAQTKRAKESAKEAEAQRELAETAKVQSDLDAKRAEESAKKAETEKERADSSAAVATRNAELARIARESAEAAKVRSDLNAERAQQALSDTRKALSEVQNLSLRDVNEMIYRLEYKAAVEKLYSLIPLEVQPDTLAMTLLEPAFWYAETGNEAKAYEILQKSYSLLGRIVPEDLSPERQSLRKAIQMLSPERDSFLETRYFPVMIRISGGVFTMGSEDGASDEQPPHKVSVSDFRMAETETTWWQYMLYVKAMGGIVEQPKKPGWGWEGDNPMVFVNWFDAMKYATWLSQRMGLPVEVPPVEVAENWKKLPSGYRLPTEAEWEYAARSGSLQQQYAGTDSIAMIGKYAWYYGNSDSRTRQVKGRLPNAFGLYGLSGNVWEWCWDWYDRGFYEKCEEQGIVTDPEGPSEGRYRVLRGGCWLSDAGYCRTANRLNFNPEYRFSVNLGFRLVLVPQFRGSF